MRIGDELLQSFVYASVSVAVLCAGIAHAGDDLITKPSKYSVTETIDRIEQAVTTKGMKIFARINHAGEAKKAGLGNEAGGTADFRQSQRRHRFDGG